ncbi:MAG TPA: hypothetical protein VGN43_07480 [Steroidobacteraceae bacterium]|jgi:hypothetical protein|nr:hypothetical protein [Steroidobacteraceae bacterium]
MTRTTMIAAGLLLCAGALPIAHADCGPAPQPAFAIPDGAHASKDEMSAARDNLSDYSAQVAAYASCLDAEEAASGRSAGTDTQHLQSASLHRGGAALLRLASIVSCFSQQVQAFHTTGGGNDATAADCSRPEARRTADGLQTAPNQPR